MSKNVFVAKGKISYKLLSDTIIDRLRRLEANTLFTNFLLLLAFHFNAIDFIIRMAITFYVNMLAYFINDFIDVDIDLAAEGKDHAKARFLKENKRTAIALIVCLSVILLIFTLFYSQSVCFGIIWVVFVIFIYTDYFKSRAYWDIFGCFLWAVSLSWIAIPDFSFHGIKLIVLLGLFSCCTEIAQCIKDYDSDKKYGLRTTPVALGIEGTFRLIRMLFVVATLYAVFILREWIGILILIPLFFSTTQPITRYWFKLRIVFGFVWLVIMIRLYLSGGTAVN